MSPHRPPLARAALAGPVLLTAALLGQLALVPTAAAADIIRCSTSRPYRDLNGDGYEDAVVGDPYATVAGQAEAGTVTILFGDSDGRIGEGARRTLTQDDLGETPEAGDHFGWAVELNRTDISGCYGILIGSPGEDVAGHADAGMAHIFTINSLNEDGPSPQSVANLDQSVLGGTVEDGDQLGYSVDGFGGSSENPVTFAFGAPGENDGAGVVNITDSYALTQRGTQVRQGSGGVPGKLQKGDRFGEVIQFDRSFLPVEQDDDYYLWVGAPGDTVSGHRGAGSLTAVSRYSKAVLLTQNSKGVPGTAESGDHFGASIAQSQLPPLPAFKQLAIGSPGEDLGSANGAGSVTVLKRRWTKDAIETLPPVVLSQRTAGVAGTAESGDAFGASISYRDDRTLGIGVPGEDLGAVADAGSVQIVRVGASKLSFPSPTITEDSPGTPGAVRAGSRFGSTVEGLPSTDVIYLHDPPPYGEGVFAIASPLQGGGSVYVISDDPENAPRAWVSGANGIGAGKRFGQSVG